jgi:hypothetical protein
MAKKKKLGVKDIVKKKKPQQKRHHITQEEYLEHLIMVSERSVTSQGSSIDEFFQQQANRLRKELEELRKSK